MDGDSMVDIDGEELWLLGGRGFSLNQLTQKKRTDAGKVFSAQS